MDNGYELFEFLSLNFGESYDGISESEIIPISCEFCFKKVQHAFQGGANWDYRLKWSEYLAWKI